MSSPSANTRITGFRQVAITVADVARSTRFYRDALGLPFLFEAGPNLAFLSAGDVRVMLSSPEGEFKPGGGTCLYFKVADIVAAYGEMKDRGVEFIDEPHLIAKMPDHDLWLVAFQDPDGNALALMCERPQQS